MFQAESVHDTCLVTIAITMGHMTSMMIARYLLEFSLAQV